MVSSRRPIWRLLTALLVCGGLGCSTEAPEPARPPSITVLVWSPDRILGPISARLPRFTAKTGIRVKVKSVMDLGMIFAESQSPNHDVDVVIALNVWVGDFVNTGFIEPLDAFIQADIDDPELSWSTIPDGVKLKNTWGGRTYSMICDNDNMFLIYRKDVLANPVHQQDFLAKHGYPLPNPPATIDELVDVATFFDGKDWDNDGTNERGFVISRKSPDELMYWYALGLTTPYTVMPAAVAAAHQLPRGLFMFKPDMTPLVNSPGFKTGIARWLALARLASPNAGRQSTIDEVVRGEALMALDWGDTGPAALAPGSEARGKLGFALPPGTRSYYDWVTGAMVDTGTNVHHAPLHQANGFAFYMTSTSENKDAVWRFIKYMNSPEISLGIVTDPRGGYQPWRTSHIDVAKWVEAGWQREDATNYVDAILKSVNHLNASLDLRIPGIFAYGAALEKHLVNLLAAPEPNIDAEMEACATDLNTVTSANQVEAQRAAYRAHLGLPQ
jgi:multiple sugar transport system substrate-binding protein